jgi:signal peptidase
MTAPAPTVVPTRPLRMVDHVTAALSSFALVVIVLVALVMIVVPLAIHATPFTVLTGSMRPTMPPGTLAVTRTVDTDSIEIGDVVTYQLHSNQPEVVTHRVVGVGFTGEGERLFVTRGDANNVDDDPVRAVQVRGVVAYHVPYLGYVNTWVGINRPGWLLKAVAGVLILYGLVLVGAGARDRLRRRHTLSPAGSAADAAPAAMSAAPAQARGVVVERAPAAPSVPVRRPLSTTSDRARRAPATGAVVAVVVLAGLVVGLAVVGRRSR